MMLNGENRLSISFVGLDSLNRAGYRLQVDDKK